jgi:hypothetical protein
MTTYTDWQQRELDIKSDEAYLLGWDAFYDHKHIGENPYGYPHLVEANDWLRGWQDCKRLNSHLTQNSP